MKKVLVFISMVAATVMGAETNYVIFSADNGQIRWYDTKCDIQKWAVSADGSTFKIPCSPSDYKLCSTTNANVSTATNISQLSKSDVNALDMSNDYTAWTERERKMLSLMVKEINILRLREGLPERTKAQVIQALKGE